MSTFLVNEGQLIFLVIIASAFTTLMSLDTFFSVLRSSETPIQMNYQQVEFPTLALHSHKLTSKNKIHMKSKERRSSNQIITRLGFQTDSITQMRNLFTFIRLTTLSPTTRLSHCIIDSQTDSHVLERKFFSSELSSR